jgi:predicted ester cyclase
VGTDNKAILLRAMERYDAGDLDGYMELYAPSIVLHGYSPEPLTGWEQVRGFYESFFAAFSDVSLRSEDELVDGDKVATRFTLGVTHTGEFWGAAPTGARATASGITILRFDGGKCVERWSSFDFLGLLMQIGVVPPPPAG